MGEEVNNEQIIIYFRDSLMFWSDVTSDTIHRANLNGTEEVVMVNSCIGNVGMHIFNRLYMCIKQQNNLCNK